MKYAVIGTGGVGGYYGAMLAKAGHEVHFLLHSDYDYVKTNGLRVTSWKGDFTIDNVLAYDSASEMPEVDVVIVALKTTNNHLLPQLLKNVVGRDTVVLLIQNGIDVESDLYHMMGNSVKLAAGLAFICSAKNEPGHIEHMDLGNLNVAQYSCAPQEVERIVTELCNAGVEAKAVEYHEARWKKAVWNMPFNGLSVVMSAQTNMLLENRHTRQLVRNIMKEVAEMATMQGVHIGDDYIDQMITMTEKMKPYSPSMKLDYDYARPMEIHYIYSKPIKIANSFGISTPLLSMLKSQLRYLDHEQLDFNSPSSAMPKLTDNATQWPDPRKYNCEGRIAVGGDLSPERLMSAYHRGIFPWYAFRFEDIYWHCPLERFVIDPAKVHISHSMRSLIRKQTYMVSIDECFEGVIYCCGKLREHEAAAWLGQHIVDAYTELHRQGKAMSVEVWKDDKLVGGLYGVKTHNIFIGESMFSIEPSASKLALIALGEYLVRKGVKLIDCQMETPHLKSMGGYYIDYDEYMQIMNEKPFSDEPVRSIEPF